MKKIFLLLIGLFVMQAAFSQNNPWIINDDFSSNKNNWIIDSNAKYQFKISYGHYGLSANDGPGYFSTKHFFIDQSHDYKIETVIQNFSGIDTKLFGMTFGNHSGNGFYFFISKDGFFKIMQQVNPDSIKVICDDKYTDAIRQGKNYNKLSVINLKGKWSFRINDQEVYSCDRITFAGNTAGFFVPGNTTIFCYSFKAYDWTIEDNNPGITKEPIYNNVFADDFSSNKNDWSTKNDENDDISFSDNYTISRKTSGFFISTLRMPVSNFLDFRIDLTLTHKAGAIDQSFGLCFSETDADNLSVFSISADGSFHVGKFIKGEWSNIKQWIESDAIKQGNYNANTISFEQTKGKWNFYINNTLVYTCDKQMLFESRFGCYVEDVQTIRFDNLRISSIQYHQ